MQLYEICCDYRERVGEVNCYSQIKGLSQEVNIFMSYKLPRMGAPPSGRHCAYMHATFPCKPRLIFPSDKI